MAKTSTILNAALALSAVIISGAAAYIAWDQAQTAKVQKDASVLPAIQIDRFEDDEGATISVGFDVQNAGVGPAFMKSATLRDGGEELQGYEHLSGVVPMGMEMDTEQLTGRTLAPGIELVALRMRWSSDAPEGLPKDKIYVATDKMTLEVCYCSTLDKCWIAKSGDRAQPKPVEACPEPEGGLF
jgi:hypothetical protein